MVFWLVTSLWDRFTSCNYACKVAYIQYNCYNNSHCICITVVNITFVINICLHQYHHQNQDGHMVAASGSSPHQWSILWLCRNSVPTFALSWKLCQGNLESETQGRISSVHAMNVCGHPVKERSQTCIEWVFFREVPVPGELISW